MGTPAKTVENQTKHLTQEERAARSAAEESVRPKREKVKLKKPKGLSKAAEAYWKSILKRMEGVEILDDLDSEMLGVYCSMLAELDALRELFDGLLAEAVEADKLAFLTEHTDSLGKLFDKQAKLESLLHTYADKLGLTPQGRARLAQKRASAELMPGDSLFGD